MTARVFRGVPASGGVAAGVAWRIGSSPGSAAANGQAAAMGVDEALQTVARDLIAAAARLQESGHADEAEIVSVGALIAEDPGLLDDVNDEVRAGADPASAITAVAERYAGAMESLRDPALRERAADFRQVGRRAASLVRGERPAMPSGPGPQVLVAEELGPAEVVGPGGGEVAAAVAVRGGPNSHAAIVARSLGLPLVLGIDAAILRIPDGTAVVVDGDEGTVTVRPGAEQMGRAAASMRAATRRRAALAGERDLPTVTTDGHRIGLLCNVGTAAETAVGLEAGAEGVGLLRTELAFLDAAEWPDEGAHRGALGPILGLLEGRRAIVRILDFGGDKVPPFLFPDLPERPGPHLRGLPSLLRSEDALGAQLRAALDLGRACLLGILVPMVTSLREVRLARSVLERAAADTGTDIPELGVMVEVPSAALLADRLAQEVQFLSIGTNDLTEHVLGVNRRDPLARPALAAHPSVLTLMNRVARAGRDQGCAVRVCGEAGADPLVLPLLVGIGVESVSVSPSRVDEVRARVRRLSAEACSEGLGRPTLRPGRPPGSPRRAFPTGPPPRPRRPAPRPAR